MKTLSKEIKAIYGKSSFVKIKNDAFAIEKVQVAFVKTESGASTDSGDFYLDFGESLSLCRDIEFGILFKDANASKDEAAKSGKKYASAVRTYQGGTPEAKSQRRDGKAVARVFYIEPGQRQEYPIVFKYEEGPGTSNAQGLIVPDWWKGGRAEKSIIVPISKNELMSMALLLKTHISGYIARNYIDGSYEKERTPTSGHTQTGSTQKEAPVSNNSPKASAKAPKTAASGKHMVVEFVSTFVDANDAVKYAEVKQTDGKTGYLWVTTSFWNEMDDGRKREILNAMSSKKSIEIGYKVEKEKEQSFVYLVA